ncbi:unnamed protein product [Pocillopora meandrina]|uniref:Dynactin subunit 1 n=1 Tax=Pocillopora meandrina TaxID=46732 RepID=A0AAU9WQT8_9CNID|nr:unnamed protein product [Pocillopora meandrina]
MSGPNAKIGMKVKVVETGLVGTVAYVGSTGSTMFASGKWIGVILDEAKGENDGSVQGKEYFKCAENHGIFVDQSQIEILQDVQTSLLSPCGLLTCSSIGGGTSIPLPSSMRREKVETALGVEETVETPTDMNRKLKEDIDTLRETVLDMKALMDLNKQLEENHLQTERDLREELEMKNNKVCEMEYKLKAAQESIRDLEAKWQEAQMDLNKQLEENHLQTERDLREELEMKNNKVCEMEHKLKAAQETNGELEAKLQKALMDLNKQLEENHLQTERDPREELEMNNKVCEMEHKLKAAQESIRDLEGKLQKALMDLNKQLEENHLQAERDLSEELEMKNNKVCEMENKLKAAQESIRDLGAKLQMEHKLKAAQESIRDLEAKLQTIENESRKFDMQQANEKIRMHQSFPSTSFSRKGGDSESFLLLQLMPLLSFKTEWLQSRLRQKYEITECLEDPAKIQGETGEGLSFASGLIYRLAVLQAVVKNIIRALDQCDAGLFNKLVGKYPQLAAHGRGVDRLVDFFERDKLDDSVSLEPLEKAIHCYTAMVRSHLAGNPVSHSEFLSDELKIFTAGTECATIGIERLKQYSKDCDEGNAFGELVQEMELRNVKIQQLCRKIKRRISEDQTSTLSFSGFMVIQESLIECARQQSLVLKFCQELATAVSQNASSLANDENLLSGQLDELASDVAVLVFETDEVPCKDIVSHTLDEVISFLSSFVTKIQEGDHDAEPKEESKVMASADTSDKKIAQALENQGGTQKRQRKDEVENETAAKAKRRRSGSDTVARLPEENDFAQKWKMKEMQQLKQRLEAESEKKEQSKKQHQDLMQVLLQQTKQQQEQMEDFKQMFTSMYEQQSQIIRKLLEKQNKTMP